MTARSLYRQLLREIDRQVRTCPGKEYMVSVVLYELTKTVALACIIQLSKIKITKKNGNPIWRQHLRQRFELSREEINFFALQREANNVLLFLKSNRQHRELLEFYFSTMNEDERIVRTANRVGLQLPKMFDPDSEVANDKKM